MVRKVDSISFTRKTGFLYFPTAICELSRSRSRYSILIPFRLRSSPSCAELTRLGWPFLHAIRLLCDILSFNFNFNLPTEFSERSIQQEFDNNNFHLKETTMANIFDLICLFINSQVAKKIMNSKPHLTKSDNLKEMASPSNTIHNHQASLQIQETIRNIMIICLEERWQGSERQLDEQLQIFYSIPISKISYSECLALFLIGKIQAMEYLIKRNKWHEKRLSRVKQIKEELKSIVQRKLKDCFIGQMQFKKQLNLTFTYLKEDQSIEQMQY